jgi:hypothetical protein
MAREYWLVRAYWPVRATRASTSVLKLRAKNEEYRVNKDQDAQLDIAMEDLCVKLRQLREANELLEDLHIENQIL